MALKIGGVTFTGTGAIEGVCSIQTNAVKDCQGSCGTAGQILSSTGTDLEWITLAGAPNATNTSAGIVFGCTTTSIAALGCNAGGSSSTGSHNTLIGVSAGSNLSSGAYNTLVGSGSGITLTTGSGNLALGRLAGDSITSGSNNVAIGYNTNVAVGSGNCQLAIGFSATDNWLTGDSTKAIRPGAGIIDCSGATGTTGQVLTSNGSNAICWATPSTGSSATPIVEGFVFGCTNTSDPYNTTLGYCAGASAVTSGGFSYNTLVGWCSGQGITSAGFNTALGSWSLLTSTNGSNTAIGSYAMCAAPSAQGGVFIGVSAGSLTSSTNSVGIGSSAATRAGGSEHIIIGNAAGLNLACTLGENSIAIGSRSQQRVSTSFCNVTIGSYSACGGIGDYTQCGNVAVGVDSIRLSENACYNTAIGFRSGCNLTTGPSNVIIGSATGTNLTTESKNVLVGPGVLLPSTGLNCQLAIGYGPADNWLTGNASKAIKPGAGIIDCTGSTGTIGQVLASDGSNALCWASISISPATPTTEGIVYGCSNTYNTALGCNAGQTFTSGAGNTFIGTHSGNTASTTSDNTLIGSYAGVNIDVGCYNTFLGAAAGGTIVTGSCNVAIGTSVAFPSDSDCQLAIGFSATDNWLTGDSTKAIKPGAGIIDCAGSCGTAGQVLMSNGANAVCWATSGGGGGSSPATPTVEGILYGCSTSYNTYLGCSAGALTSTGTCNTLLGTRAACSVTTGVGNVALGFDAGVNVTGSNNTILGTCSSSALTTGNYNVAIGSGVNFASNGDCQLAIGFSPTSNWLTGDSTKAIKPGAGIIDCAGSCGTAGQVLSSDGANAVCWTSVGASATPLTQGLVIGCTTVGVPGNTFLGESAGEIYPTTAICCDTLLGYRAGCNTTSCYSVFVGHLAGANHSGCYSVAIGHNAGASATSFSGIAIGCAAGCLHQGVGGIGIGSQALTVGTGSNNIGIGCRSLYYAGAGISNVAVGAYALTGNAYSSTCNPFQNTAIGAYAGYSIEDVAESVFVGHSAGSSLRLGTNNILIGASSSPSSQTVSNEITLGDNRITSLRANVTSITSLSDARDKTEITALPVGLDFINELNPVKFAWNMRVPSETKDGTYEAGFLAQELQEAESKFNASDYLGLVYNSNPERLEATPGKLIPVLVKAIQELSEKVDALQSELDTLKGN